MTVYRKLIMRTINTKFIRRERLLSLLKTSSIGFAIMKYAVTIFETGRSIRGEIIYSEGLITGYEDVVVGYELEFTDDFILIYVLLNDETAAMMMEIHMVMDPV